MAGSAWISSAHIPEVHHTVTLIAMEAGTGKQSPETKVPKPQHNMCPMLCLLVAWTPPPNPGNSLSLSPFFYPFLPFLFALPGLLNPSPRRLWVGHLRILPSSKSWLTNCTFGVCRSLHPGFSNSSPTLSAWMKSCVFQSPSVSLTVCTAPEPFSLTTWSGGFRAMPHLSIDQRLLERTARVIQT